MRCPQQTAGLVLGGLVLWGLVLGGLGPRRTGTGAGTARSPHAQSVLTEAPLTGGLCVTPGDAAGLSRDAGVEGGRVCGFLGRRRPGGPVGPEACGTALAVCGLPAASARGLRGSGLAGGPLPAAGQRLWLHGDVRLILFQGSWWIF